MERTLLERRRHFSFGFEVAYQSSLIKRSPMQKLTKRVFALSYSIVAMSPTIFQCKPPAFLTVQNYGNVE